MSSKKQYGRSGNGLIHLLSPLNAEFTLCGDAFDICDERDNAEEGLEWEYCPPAPITCGKCARVIIECRRVRIAPETFER